MSTYNLVIALLNAGGAGFLGLATIWGLYSHETQTIGKDFWLTYTTAAASGTLFLGFRAL